MRETLLDSATLSRCSLPCEHRKRVLSISLVAVESSSHFFSHSSGMNSYGSPAEEEQSHVQTEPPGRPEEEINNRVLKPSASHDCATSQRFGRTGCDADSDSPLQTDIEDVKYIQYHPEH